MAKEVLETTYLLETDFAGCLRPSLVKLSDYLPIISIFHHVATTGA